MRDRVLLSRRLGGVVSLGAQEKFFVILFYASE